MLYFPKNKTTSFLVRMSPDLRRMQCAAVKTTLLEIRVPPHEKFKLRVFLTNSATSQGCSPRVEGVPSRIKGIVGTIAFPQISVLTGSLLKNMTKYKFCYYLKCNVKNYFSVEERVFKPLTIEGFCVSVGILLPIKGRVVSPP